MTTREYTGAILAAGRGTRMAPFSESYPKPLLPNTTNRLKGVGLYLFDPAIFDAIRRTPRTAMRDEYEITNSIQVMIEDGYPVRVAKLTHTMCSRAGIQSGVLRLFNSYGPGQALSPYVGVVTIFINALRNGEHPMIFGDGEQCRDFVHVEDVVSGFVRAMDADVTGETFNIGTGEPISVNAVLRSLNRVMRTTSPGRQVAPVPGELHYSVADIRKAQNLLGYEPAHRFESSIDVVVHEILRDSTP